METSRTREPLSSGTIIRLPDGFCCQITGPVISEGGGGIVYPVSRVRIDTEGVHRQEMEYALKECFPLSAQHRLCRREDGAIVAEGSDEQSGDFLAYVKKMQLAERDITSRIYHTAFRMVPILESAAEVELSFDEGRSFQAVENVVTVMESLVGKGMTLKAFLADYNQGVPALVALRIIQQVLYALREVHNAGFLHLDIQDGNILLQGNLDDGSIQATLIDFGSARLLLEDDSTAPISDRALFSTRGFSAPEMAQNDGTLRLGPQADLYSTGYLLLFLLTGARYDPRSLANARGGQVLTAMRMRHTQCPAHLRVSLQALLQKALAQEPTERYASADEMLRDVTVLADALAPKQSDLAAVAYDAFICYRHNERDDRATAALRHALEHYRIPSEVRKATGKERFERVFLDTDELSSCANLGAAIHDALVSAPWLIVVCSPETPGSPWVAQEIDTFLEHHDASHILTVLTAGEPDESFPERLRSDSRDSMMFAADARADTVREMEKTIRRDTVLRVAAPMLGVSYDALRQRRRAWQMRRGMAALGAVLAVALVFLGVVWQDNLRIQQEYEAAQVRESRLLAQESQHALFEGDNRMEAVRLALQALPNSEQQRPYSAEAELALSEALRHYSPYQATYYEVSMDTGGEVVDACISDDLQYVTVTSIVDDTVWVSTWDPDTGSPLWKRRLGDLAATSYGFTGAYFNTVDSFVKFVPGTDTLIVGTNLAVSGVDAGKGEILWNKELYAVVDNYEHGMLYDVVIPVSKDPDAHPDTAYLFRLPEDENAEKYFRIDAIDVENGNVRHSVDTEVGCEGWSSIYEHAFLVAPSQDYALIVGSRKDDTSEYVCVSLADGSTTASGELEGIQMSSWVYADEGLNEDWFVTTYQAGADEVTPGTMRWFRIENAPEEEGDAGRSWEVALPMSHAWSKPAANSRAQLLTAVRNNMDREAPMAFHFGQSMRDGSINLALAADCDIYTVDAVSGELLAHEVTDAAVVGYTWGTITARDGNKKDTPFLAYADGGIDYLLIRIGQTLVGTYKADGYRVNPGDSPPYFNGLDDTWLMMKEADSSVEGQNAHVVVSADEPSVVKTLGNTGDQNKAVAVMKSSEGRTFSGSYTNLAMLSPRGDYLCMRDAAVSDDDAESSTRDGFVLYETKGWQERACCEVDEGVGRMLGLTADGMRVIWQAKGQDGTRTGLVYLTELASGQTEMLAGLSADAKAHYAASAFDVEDDSVVVAVLSYEDGQNQPYTARLYRDGRCTAEMSFSLERGGDRLVYHLLQRTTPLAVSASGMLAFDYTAENAVEVGVFVDMANGTICTAESSAVSNNNPSCACLSRDGMRYASADSDGVVRIWNTHDGSLVCSYTPDSNVRGLSFIAGDGQLALYTGDYRLLALDAASGEVVSETTNVRSEEYEAYLNRREGLLKLQLQNLEISGIANSIYHDISIYETEHDLIVCTALGEGCIIDRESMAVRRYVPGIAGYSISADAVLVDATGKVFAYPAFSVADLVAEAEGLLSGDAPPATDENE